MKLGIIGGFGGFATLDFFGRLLSEFASETERSYPHIVTGNQKWQIYCLERFLNLLDEM